MPVTKHLDDAELIAFWRGEIGPDQIETILAHADACRPCSLRLEQMEPAMGQFYSWRELEEVPPPPQSKVCLTARMERWDWDRRRKRWSAWIGASAAAAAAVVLLLWPSRATELRAEALLRQSAAAYSAHPPTHKQLRIHTRQASFLRPAVERRTPAIREEDNLGAIFSAARYDWDDPLNPEAYALWRNSLAKKDVRVTEDHGEFRVDTLTREGSLREATLTLAADHLPVSGRFVFDNSDWVEITVVPETSRIPEAPLSAAAPAHPAASVRREGPLPNPAERMLAVRVAIDQLRLPIGEPIHIDTRADGGLLVTPYRLPAEKLERLRALLGTIPGVQLLLTDEGGAAPGGASPVDPVIDTSDAIVSRAHLLHELATGFPPAVEGELTAASRTQLADLRRRQVAQLRADIDTLCRQLTDSRPAFRSELSAAAGKNPLSDWSTVALVDAAARVNRQIAGLFDGADTHSGNWPPLAAEVAHLRRIAHALEEQR